MQLTSFIVLALLGFSTAAPGPDAVDEATSSHLQARDDNSYGDYSVGYEYDDGSWYPGKYPDGSQYDDGSWYPGKYDHKPYNSHKSYGSHLEARGDDYSYDDGYKHSTKHDVGSKYDDGSWYPGKYPDGSQYDDGSWYPGKYDGSQYDDKRYDSHKSYDKDFDYDKHGDYGKDKCPTRKDAVPFNRMCYPEGVGAASIIGYFFNWQVYNTVPLYVLYNSQSKDYFYTTDKQEKRKAIAHKGYESKDIAGFIFADESCGCVPLFRLYDPKSCQHFYTTSSQEKKKAIECGYKFESIEGYVFQW